MRNQYQLQKKLINKEFESCPTPANISGGRGGETSSPKIIKEYKRKVPSHMQLMYIKGRSDWDSFATFSRLFSDADARKRKRQYSFNC